MLRSKIHRATLTGTELDYEGSIAIDRDLIEAADLLPGEQVHVLNLSNAERLITYVIEAPAGSGTMMLNGPAARLGAVGDKVVIIRLRRGGRRRGPQAEAEDRPRRREEPPGVTRAAAVVLLTLRVRLWRRMRLRRPPRPHFSPRLLGVRKGMSYCAV